MNDTPHSLSDRQDDDEETFAPSVPKKNALLAAGLSFSLLGLGQAYGGLRLTGILLTANFGVLILWATSGYTLFAWGSAMALTLAVDIIAGQAAVRRTNSRKRTSTQAQFALGLIEIVLIQFCFFSIERI
jgi:TM2 domain-containing membrane protein YozV